MDVVGGSRLARVEEIPDDDADAKYYLCYWTSIYPVPPLFVPLTTEK
jgi:hypothetical protein